MLYRTIILGGLLHGIGTFLQNDNLEALNTKEKDAEISVEFIRRYSEQLQRICDTALLEKLVMKDYESPDLPENLKEGLEDKGLHAFVSLVSRADNYSSAGQDEQKEKKQDYSQRPLDAIFARLSIGKPLPKPLQYKATVYSPENAFPVALDKQSEVDFSSVLKSFREEFKKITAEINNFKSYYSQLFSLLQKYIWCIPSNPQEKIADTSLFDHLKTTSAIAACLYQYHKFQSNFNIKNIADDKANKFLLLVGDISGIQNYIFSGSQIGAGAVAKRLRARSFFLSMLSELVTHNILRSFDLPIANNLIASGGKFYILLPNIEKVKERLNEIQNNITSYLLREFQGELALNTAWQEMSGSDFESFGSILAEITGKLAVKKKMPYKGILNTINGWDENQFVFNIKMKQEPVLCKGCGKEFAKQIVEEREYGKNCLRDLEIGKILPKTSSIEFTKNDQAHIQFLDGIGLKLNSSISEKTSSNSVFILNNSNIYSNAPIITKFIANYVPTENGQAISFDQLIDKSKGIQRLAYLKADVDNLGSLFAFGLKQENQTTKNYDSISRITTLSRMLDIFFSGMINNLLSQEFKNCYTVYSGGDDLLLVGPWNEIIDLSLRINNEFRKFVSFNENITLSAGISMAKNRTPVVKAVNDAEILLEDSKDKILKGKVTGRNQVSIFNNTLSWNDYEKAITEAKKLTAWVEKNSLTRSDLWKLKKYYNLFSEFYYHGRVEGLKYKAFLAYDIGRKKKEGYKNSEVLEWLKKLFELTNPLLINLDVIVSYTLFSVRR